MTDIIVHYTPQNEWEKYRVRILCGAEFETAVTNSKDAVTCKVCLKLLKQEQVSSEVEYGETCC